VLGLERLVVGCAAGNPAADGLSGDGDYERQSRLYFILNG
jgi:hypothetical protein